MAPTYKRRQRAPLVRDTMPAVSKRTEKTRVTDNAVKVRVAAPATAATTHVFQVLPPMDIVGDSKASTRAYRQMAAAITDPVAVTHVGRSGSWNSSTGLSLRRSLCCSAARAISIISGVFSESRRRRISWRLASSGASPSSRSRSCNTFWCSWGAFSIREV
jgi:hypothetical protein